MGCGLSQPNEGRLKRLKTLLTRGQFMLLELRPSANYIELNGEDVDGIHAALTAFFAERMRATPYQWNETEEPFCDLKFHCNKPILRMRGIQGESNMGLVAISVVDFMSEKGWDLHCREDLSFVFSQRPSNSTPPIANLMLEVRPGVNYVEVNGKDVDGIFYAIRDFFNTSRFLATAWDWKGQEPFCNMKLSCRSLWRCRGRENDAGMVATAIADYMSEQGWELRDLMGTRNEKTTGPPDKFWFVKRAAALEPAQHLTLELRPFVNYVEINGRDTDGIYDVLSGYFQQHFGATLWDWQGQEPFCGLKLRTKSNLYRWRGMQGENDLGMTMVKIFDLMVNNGWDVIDHVAESCTFVKQREPSPPRSHLLIEFRPSVNYIEINGADKDGIHEHLFSFLRAWLSAAMWDWKGREPFCGLKLQCPNFLRVRGMSGENDYGMVAVAVMDFLGQHGWALVKRNRMTLLFAK